MSEQKSRKNAKYKAVIIGAGRIAAQFDYSKSKEVLTHAHAFRRHKKTKLIGFFDTNKKAAQKAAKKWRSKAFSDLDEMLSMKPDIVSICTPNEAHFNNLLKVAKYKPKIVVCEKPFTTNIEDSAKIVKLYKKFKIPLLIDHIRRFDSAVQKVKLDMDQNKYGKIICASTIYAKGILHSGTHIVDLCRFLFGEVKRSAIFYSVSDHGKKDKSLAGFMEFSKCKQFHLMAGDERKYSIFEFDIILEKARLRFYDFGFYLSSQKVEKDPLYAGYQCLAKPIIIKTSLDKAMLGLIDNAINHLENKELLICSADDALATQRVCQSLLNKH